MFSGVGSFAICWRARISESSRTSSPFADRTCEKPVGSVPSPPGTGVCGRYPRDPVDCTDPATRRWSPESPTITETIDDLPVPLRPTRPTFSLGPILNAPPLTRVRGPISILRSETESIGVGQRRESSGKCIDRRKGATRYRGVQNQRRRSPVDPRHLEDTVEHLRQMSVRGGNDLTEEIACP